MPSEKAVKTKNVGEIDRSEKLHENPCGKPHAPGKTHFVQFKTSSQQLVDPYWTLLDSGLTVHVFSNAGLLNGIHEHLVNVNSVL